MLLSGERERDASGWWWVCAFLLLCWLCWLAGWGVLSRVGRGVLCVFLVLWFVYLCVSQSVMSLALFSLFFFVAKWIAQAQVIVRMELGL